MILEPIDGGAAVVGESAHHRSQASVMVIGERVGHDCIRIDGDVLGRLGFRPDAAKALCYGRSASKPLFFSRQMTESPSSAARQAATVPAVPEPTITTSACSVEMGL